jgi:bacterial leucyl aminopeptidase
LIFRENSRSPGADDDASGVASLSEVARVLLESGYRPKRTIEFMAYSAEEEGLLGSADIAKRYADAGRNVVGVMQLDMTNYQGGAEDIVLIGDYTSAAQNQFVANLASTYLPALNVTQSLCGYACSDHASWTANGYASSFPFEAVLGQDNPYIHTKGDTLAKSNDMASHAVKFSRLALAFLVELGSDAPAAAQR